MSGGQMDDDAQLLLPALRSELKIVSSAAGHDGVPNWVIHDPLQHRYFQINHETKEVISIWREGLDATEFIELTGQELGLEIDQAQISHLIEFLRNNSLLAEPERESWRDISDRATRMEQSFLSTVLKNYVFFKIPLVRPQSTLTAFMPFVSFVYSRLFFTIIIFSGIAGLYFVSRQWDGFVGHFLSFLTLQGLAYFGLALIGLKAVHELGHAFTATRYGVQVPTMGVAFFLLTPLLYTDVSDAWRLSSRRQRFAISSAGIVTELMVACVATLAWVFLPDGTSRDIALIFATTGWMMSLVVNLNPLIKFDGYYLLSDVLGIDNLQQRSFALGKWKMRQMIFAPSLPVPENLSSNMRNGLIIFAWMTWLYRVVLFTTIALVVYHFAFKLLGILLLIIEVWLLVARPIFNEIKEWYKLGRGAVSPAQLSLSIIILGCMILSFVLPWSTRVEIPAVLESAKVITIYPVRSAKIVSIHSRRGEFVRQNTPIAQLYSPELAHEIHKTKINISLVKRRMANAVVKGVDRDLMLVLRQTYKFEKSKLAGLMKEQSELVIKAPISGVLKEINRDLHPGRWIRKNEHIALVVAPDTKLVRGYLQEGGLTRLNKNAMGKFIPDDLTRSSVNVVLKSIAKAASPVIEIAQLASVNGGKVGAERNSDNLLVPSQSQYLLELQPQGSGNVDNQVVRGVVILKGDPESLLTSVGRQLSRVLVRESSF